MLFNFHLHKLNVDAGDDVVSATRIAMYTDSLDVEPSALFVCDHENKAGVCSCGKALTMI